MRLLVVEDEPDLNQVIRLQLESENYSVDSCFNGKQALDYIFGAEYDGIVLDIMMPEMDGMQLLQELRKRKIAVPVLLLTAKDSVQDRVGGLDAGADDYLVKPFDMQELLARIRVMMRRASGQTSNQMQVADLVIDSDAHTVHRGAVPIALSGKEFAILEYMALNAGTVLSRDKIEQHIWNYDYEGGSNVVDVYIRYLRKKIDDDFSPKLLHTVRGVGYVLRVEA